METVAVFDFGIGFDDKKNPLYYPRYYKLILYPKGLSILPAFFGNVHIGNVSNAVENVERCRSSRAFAAARRFFKGAGYGLTEVVLDASRCGAPQKRKRFVCLGVQGAAAGFATEIIESRLSKTPTTVRDYFGESLPFEYCYRHPRNYNRRAVFSVDEPAPTMRGVNRPVPKGYPGRPNDACALAEHPEVRALTTAERAKIQTFPDDFVFTGSKTDVEQMIGNAVPVKLAEFVAETLRLSMRI